MIPDPPAPTASPEIINFPYFGKPVARKYGWRWEAGIMNHPDWTKGYLYRQEIDILHYPAMGGSVNRLFWTKWLAKMAARGSIYLRKRKYKKDSRVYKEWS